jgi:spore coat polysaccharide biosynthesis predicted glycosyltransferase SpsG
MGGADPNGLTYKILNSAGALFPEYHWIAVCTKSFGENWLEKLGDLERQRKNISIKLQLDAAEMHRLMLESGKAIVSSSTVLIEAWASGLYPAAICYTENQQMIYQGSINTDMAFPLHTDDLTNGLEHYLKGKQRFKGRTNEWNPPLCILHAMQELTAS